MALSPQTTVQTPLQSTVPPRKSGCGCWLWGCLTLVILAVLGSVGFALLLYFSPDILLSDTVIEWTYRNYGRPQIEAMLPHDMSAAEKKRILREADATLQDFLNLSNEQKERLKEEAMTALYYYSQNQVIPPEKIPNLIMFIETHIERFKYSPQDAPRLMQ
ncbi:MAG: hypothetical protein ACREP8_16960 [Candidatus Binatia bacterium]